MTVVFAGRLPSGFAPGPLDVHNLAQAGLAVFPASTAGQALMGRVGECRAPPGVCLYPARRPPPR